MEAAGRAEYRGRSVRRTNGPWDHNQFTCQGWTPDLVTALPLRGAFGSIALHRSLCKSFIDDIMCLGFVLLNESWRFLDQWYTHVASAMVSSLVALDSGRHKHIRFVRHRFIRATSPGHAIPLRYIGTRTLVYPATALSLIAKASLQPGH